MPHIALNSAEPGIRGLLRYRPETARPLSELRIAELFARHACSPALTEQAARAPKRNSSAPHRPARRFP